MSNSLWPHGLQCARLPCPSLFPRVCSDSCPLSWWCYPTISSSVAPFLLLPSVFLNIRVFSTEFFTSGDQSIGASASATVHPMTSQGWFPLGLTRLISLKSKEFSIVFSSNTIRQHQFFSTRLSLWINFHIHTWLLEKTHSFDYMNLCWQSDISAF